MPPSHLPHPTQRRSRLRGLTGLLAALALTAAGLALPVGPATTSLAAGCPDSGGATIPPASAAGDVVFRGGGWGHGLGMSQYGAEGAARLGCTATQILTRYYAGTQVVPRPMPDSVRLRMLADGYRVDVEAVRGTLTWQLDGCRAPAPATNPTPSATPSPTASPAAPSCPPAQPPRARWQLRLEAPPGAPVRWVLYNLGVVPKAAVWDSGTSSAPLTLQEDGSVAHLTTWRGSSIYLERWVRWDRTAFTADGSRIDAVQRIGSTDVGSAMDKYLWGIAEVPASFPAEALKAQAIAARTYATKRAGRVLMPTPADQNWTGWTKETEGPDGVWGRAWKAAVDATSGLVVADAGSGALIDALYSSSMGGQTEDERYVWGVESPFLRAVDDSAWDAASSNPADKRAWAVGFSWAALARRLGFASVSTISVPPRGSDARTAGVKVVGIKGGTLTTSYLEGWDVRQALGLLSPGFTIRMRRTGGAGAQPLAGDWDGDGREEPGWFRDGAVALRMTGPAGAWVARFRYGRAGDVAVVGDWDRDGRDDLGVFRAGSWLLRTGRSGGAATRTVQFGRPGDVPVVGSWNGRRLGLGVVRGRLWLLRPTLTGGAATIRFRYGRAGDVPVVGSWNGRRRTGIGVERDGTWLLRNRRSAGRAGIVLSFGQAGDRPVAGDWDGDGRSTPAVVRRRVFVARGGLGAVAPTRALTFRG